MSRPALPSSATGWWATVVAVAAVVVGLFLPSMTSWSGPLQERLGRSGLPVGSSLVSVEIVLAVLALVLGVAASRRNDRSRLLLVSLVVALLVGGFWVLFALGEVVSRN